MNKENGTAIDDDYTFSRVPITARVNLFSVTLIRVGGVTALAQFMVGATLGHAMTFYQALLATFIGSLALEFVGLGLGIAGSREGLSTSLLARWCGFGRVGSVLIGIVIAVSLLGWFGIQNSILAEGLAYALDGRLTFFQSTIISGVVLTLLVAFGFSALSWIAKITVPLFFIVMCWILFGLLQGHNVAGLIAASPVGAPLTLGAGATAIAGGHILSALITPDMSRYCQNGRHVFWMITLSIIVGEFIVNGIAILIAHALGTNDVVSIMTQTAGLIGLFSVILSAVKINDLNLYSSVLGIANAVEGMTGKKWRYAFLTLALGTIGTILSAIGILEKFTDFLIFLSVFFPPVAGVMLVDYYILRTNRTLLDVTRKKGTLPDAASTPAIGWAAIAACIAGTLTGLNIKLGIPSLNSLIVASIFYWSASIISKKLLVTRRENETIERDRN